MVTLTFTPQQRARACRALLRHAETAIDGVHAILHGAGCDICNHGRIEGAERANKYRGMVLMHADRPDLADFLGGTYRATLAEDMTERLAKIDRELRAEIIAIAKMALEQSAERVGVAIRRQAKRDNLSSIEQYSYDNDPASVFVAGLRPVVADKLVAALTADEEELIAKELATAAELIEEALETASADVLSTLPGDDLTDVETAHTEHRPLAVEMFLTAMTVLVLGRLGRATDTDVRETAEVKIPPNLANDVMSVAGGVAPTADGGIQRDISNQPLTDAGETARGSRFAQGETTSGHLQETENLVADIVFRHSGDPDGNPIHLTADGLSLDDTEARAGSTPGCRCWHETIYVEA